MVLIKWHSYTAFIGDLINLGQDEDNHRNNTDDKNKDHENGDDHYVDMFIAVFLHFFYSTTIVFECNVS